MEREREIGGEREKKKKMKDENLSNKLTHSLTYANKHSPVGIINS